MTLAVLRAIAESIVSILSRIAFLLGAIVVTQFQEVASYAVSDILAGWRAVSANAPCAVVATARSPLPRRVVELTVFIFVPETRVACFVSRPVFKRFTVGYFVVFVSIVVFSLFATFSGTYPIFHSRTDQLLAVCHGVSTNARRLSPLTTGAPPRVPATFINQESHFRIAPAVPEPPEAGKVFTEAS